jgi:hypothetical protein
LGGAAGRIPASRRRNWPGEVRRSDEGFTLVGFVSSVGAGAAPVDGHDGAWQRWPRLALRRRGEAQGGLIGGLVSSSEGMWWRRTADTATGATGDGRSSAAAFMESGGNLPARRKGKTRTRAQACPFIGGRGHDLKTTASSWATREEGRRWRAGTGRQQRRRSACGACRRGSRKG